MNRTQMAWRTLFAATLYAFAVLGVQAQTNGQVQSKRGEDVLSRAMRDELARSAEKLQLAKLERPYFIAYRVHVMDEFSVSATCGSLLQVTDSRPVRTLTVELRVGDYGFDNTNFTGMDGFGFSFGSNRSGLDFGQLPLDDNYIEIRRQIWLATDAAYKQALEQLAGKKAALQNKTRTQNLPDFSKEDATQTQDDKPTVRMERSDAEALVRELSKQLGAMPDLNSSTVTLAASNVRTLYVNSEGTSYIKSQPLMTLTASASTQAADGMGLGDSLSFYTSSLDSFPSRDLLAAQVRGMGERLLRVRNAPILDRYNGPVLFEGRAAAELFKDVFAPALVGQRKPVSGDSEMAAVFSRLTQGGGSSFGDKIGARVLPDFLSVVDTPTISAYSNELLFGGYMVDDDGVRARETHLVENGILKTLLTTRTPVEGVTHSTGNHRSVGAVPSNLFVTASKVLTEAELKDQFMALIKKRGLEYGVAVREIGGAGDSMEEQAMSMLAAMTGQGGQGKSVLLAYKVYTDGREELVRGAHLSEMNADSFKEIAAASTSLTVYTSAQMPKFDFSTISSFAGDASSMPLVSYVVPSLLFDDLTLTKPSQELPKPPFSGPPPSAQ
jgi:predicted Zn-dependent protease